MSQSTWWLLEVFSILGVVPGLVSLRGEVVAESCRQGLQNVSMSICSFTFWLLLQAVTDPICMETGSPARLLF